MSPYHVKAWRQNKGMTQEQAAEWLGISWRQFQRLESGDSKVSGPIARLLYVDAPL
jgi:DNA-binding transcriptional regulator YiaG